MDLTQQLFGLLHKLADCPLLVYFGVSRRYVSCRGVLGSPFAQNSCNEVPVPRRSKGQGKALQQGALWPATSGVNLRNSGLFTVLSTQEVRLRVAVYKRARPHGSRDR